MEKLAGSGAGRRKEVAFPCRTIGILLGAADRRGRHGALLQDMIFLVCFSTALAPHSAL